MKAIAVFPKTKEIKLVEHPEPQITRATEVKLKMEHVGVCGTDREIWDFKYGTPPDGSDYLITGHESLGRVIDVGADVKTLKVGDYVVPTVRRGCTENCLSCEHMQPDFCYTGHFTERGIKQHHGFMAEYVVDEASYMNRVPSDLKDFAVLLEPLTIAQKAILQIFTIQSRLHWECRLEAGQKNKGCHNAVILGAGPVGLLAAMAFRLLNMNVIVVAREPKPNNRSAILDGIGAEYYSTRDFTPAQVAEKVGNIDLIFEATGAASVSFEFLQVLGTNGIFIFTGVPAPMNNLTIDAGTLMRNMVLMNQAIIGTVNAPKEAFENGIRDLREFKKRWPNQLAALITGHVPLHEFGETLANRKADEIKTVLTFHGMHP